MTDKQIMIDGIDVSECEHYDNVCLGNHHYKWCKDNDNCYYKQLKAKEQECERLKKQYNCYACDTCKGKEDYINLKRHCENAIKSLHNKHAELDQLKAENDELKKWLPITTRLVDEFENYEKIKGINYRIYTQVFFKKFNKLKQTLTEIKEIAHKINDECELEGFGSCALKYKEQILQKISEVIE